MEEEYEEEAPQQLSKPRGRHIKKRALKNKALAVSFNEKDLRDYVTGFHKRKKKRRKEAQKKQEEAERRKRIEQRKKRKLEKEFALYVGAPPSTASGPDESDENNEEDEGSEPTASVSENFTSVKTHTAMHRSVGDGVDRKHNLPVSKRKPLKKVARHRSRPPTKRDRNKGKKENKKMH
ncbi:Nucleolar protein 12 - like 1 [Theobroma cacao]|nr:Nucleolar protein 12 - like 1 [Theobroma cacao]